MEEIHDEIINKKYSKLITDGFRLYGKNFKNLILTWLVFETIYNLLYVLILTDLRYYFTIYNIPTIFYTIIKYTITGVLSLIVVILVCSVSTFLFKDYTLVNTKFIDEFRKSINYRLKYPIFIAIILFILFDVIFDLIQDYILNALFLSGLGVLSVAVIMQMIFYPILLLSMIISSFYIFVRFTYNIIDIPFYAIN